MSVLVEGYSIIINKQKAQQKPQALEALQRVEGQMHPHAICADQDLLRIGFLKMGDMKKFWEKLIKGGLQEGSDMVTVTQYGEMDVPCPWLQVGFQKGANDILFCLALFKDSATKPQQAAFPKGWKPEESILVPFHNDRMHYMEENYEQIDEDATHIHFREKEGEKVVKLLKLQFTAEEPAAE